jgi:hypothetical protein
MAQGRDGVTVRAPLFQILRAPQWHETGARPVARRTIGGGKFRVFDPSIAFIEGRCGVVSGLLVSGER